MEKALKILQEYRDIKRMELHDVESDLCEYGGTRLEKKFEVLEEKVYQIDEAIAELTGKEM